MATAELRFSHQDEHTTLPQAVRVGVHIKHHFVPRTLSLHTHQAMEIAFIDSSQEGLSLKVGSGPASPSLVAHTPGPQRALGKGKRTVTTQYG